MVLLPYLVSKEFLESTVIHGIDSSYDSVTLFLYGTVILAQISDIERVKK